jgi:hypothetical protein
VAPSTTVNLTVSKGPQPQGCTGGTMDNLSVGGPSGKGGDTLPLFLLGAALCFAARRGQHRPSLP